MNAFAQLIGLLAGDTGQTVRPGNPLSPSQPPQLVWGTVESDTESPSDDGQRVTWTVLYAGEIVQVPLAILDVDPHLSHDETTGTVETLTPRTGDTVLMIRSADGDLTMLGKAEGY